MRTAMRAAIRTAIRRVSLTQCIIDPRLTMNSLNTCFATVCFALASTLAFTAQAQTSIQPNQAADRLLAQAPTTDTTDGEVRKVDKEGGKLTLKHGEIKNLDMPGMIMVFAVKDKAMLDKLQAGDKVKFKAVSDGGKLTITQIDMAK